MSEIKPFRLHPKAASLKLFAKRPIGCLAFSIPPSSEGGLIEALLASRQRKASAGIPPSSEGGLIEARLPYLLC